MSSKTFEEIKKVISKVDKSLTKQLRILGATEKTIEAFFEGENEFLICPRCLTFNLYERDYKKDDTGYFSIYECNKCSALYRRNWKD